MANCDDFIIGSDDLILVTGAVGFIGCRVVERLLELGFRRLRCFARPSSNAASIEALANRCRNGTRVELFRGNLLSREDCDDAARDSAVIFHLAAGTGEKSFPEAFRNSVVTTRNLLEASLQRGCLRRFVNVSSFSVYSNRNKPQGRLLEETCPVETDPKLLSDAYSFAKVKQDEIIIEYGRRFGVPHVIVRPGYVIIPGKKVISSRVGTGAFGLFLHLGGSNTLPFTYVDNCADAIVLAGLKPDVNGEVFNVVDDDLPSSRCFLRLYKQQVRPLKSVYLPHFLSYGLCRLWERYSVWSQGQLPPTYSLRVWHTFWKKTRYTNEKLKARLGWRPKVPMAEGLSRYFKACRAGAFDA